MGELKDQPGMVKGKLYSGDLKVGYELRFCLKLIQVDSCFTGRLKLYQKGVRTNMIAQPRLVIKMVAVVAVPNLRRVGKLSDGCRIIIMRILFRKYINYDNFILEYLSSLGSEFIVFA